MSFKKIFRILCNWYEKERKILLLSVSLGFTFTVAFAIVTNAYSSRIQAGIASQVIRFHVLANSDSESDQALKLKVRDGVLEKFGPLLSDSSNNEQTKEILNANLDEIESYAEKIIKENGYDYSVASSLTKSIFPTKTYGDLTFPAGEYEALRIEIGEAKGKNWWCVMFPPLCYVDMAQTYTTAKSKTNLKDILSDEEYDIILNHNIKVKFKVVEIWQNLKYSFRIR